MTGPKTIIYPKLESDTLNVMMAITTQTSTYLNTSNLSLYTLPIAWLICLTPRFYNAFMYTTRSGKSIDLVNPRSPPVKASTEPALDPRLKNRILRAEAAMHNGLENVGYFAAAVVAGNMAGLSREVVNGLSVGYVVSRAVYNLAYMFGETTFWGAVRSILFFVGQGQIWALFILAGKELNKAGR